VGVSWPQNIMNKILLINPSIPETIKNKDIWVPINLMFIGAVLKQNGIYTEILDLNIKQWNSINDKIREMVPTIVGITCIFSGQFPQVCKIASYIKKIANDIIIVVGGIHPTLYAKDILNHCDFIDWVAVGEAEYSFLDAIKSWENNRDLSSVDGWAYRDNGKVIINNKTAYIQDLDILPIPDYSLINLDNYKLDTCGWHNPRSLSIDYMIPILSSRSCPMRCNFCSMFLSMGTKQRFRSAKKVVDEIEYLYNRYGCRRFAFIDDNLTLKKSHIKEICENILFRNLNIQFETPNGISLSHLDKEVVDLMVKAGLIRVSLAIESGSDYIRNKIIGKHLDRNKIYDIIDLFRNYPEVYVKAFFIIGMPEDTLETLEDTYNMIKEIKIDQPCISNLLPFPGTKLFEQVVRDNLLVNELDMENLWQYPNFDFTDNKNFFVKPYKMTIPELELFRQRINILIKENVKCKKKY
jgi:magnesium-protoporphyrin IX monomethyl ester (oxidative) cyclase